MLVVGKVGTFLKSYKHIVGACHLHLGVAHLLLKHLLELEGHFEIDGFLVGAHAERAGVLATVARVDDHGKLLGHHARSGA